MRQVGKAEKSQIRNASNVLNTIVSRRQKPQIHKECQTIKILNLILKHKHNNLLHKIKKKRKNKNLTTKININADVHLFLIHTLQAQYFCHQNIIIQKSCIFKAMLITWTGRHEHITSFGHKNTPTRGRTKVSILVIGGLILICCCCW